MKIEFLTIDSEDKFLTVKEYFCPVLKNVFDKIMSVWSNEWKISNKLQVIS